MIDNEKITAHSYAQMIATAAANLREHVQEVNDLNVFPIPDGDTGDNMLLTMMGGAKLKDSEEGELSSLSAQISSEMLLSARGNSGVILSQFFSGVSKGFANIYEAKTEDLKKAFKSGVEQAYKAVMSPTEGTMLTVVREATEAAVNSSASTPFEFLSIFIKEAKSSLERTPELLAVLKEAGVVDSGGAGLVYIAEGMRMALAGKALDDVAYSADQPTELNLDAFDENSELTYGYCTEVLLRLQSSKVNINSFCENVIVDTLNKIGDSLVVVKSGTVVKTHVHTREPHRVLECLQQYGEFLKVKIENMSLQHNSIIKEEAKRAPKSRKKYGVVCVASGDGVKNMLTDLGADFVVEGGQSMNPSAEELIAAFDEVNADVIYVYPNNSNVVLTAKQAGLLYSGSEIIVIESKNIGQGYASLSMLDTSLEKEELEEQLISGMDGVVTVEISRAIRNAVIDGVSIKEGDYIGICGKRIVASEEKLERAVYESLEKICFEKYDSAILLKGKGNIDSADNIENALLKKYPCKEVYMVDGQQEIYDYIIIAQ